MVGGAAAESAKAGIAVADFKIEGKETIDSEQGGAIARLLTRELVRLDKVRIVERDLLKKILAEKKLAMAGITADDPAVLGALPGLDFILGGSVSRKGGDFSLTGRLINVRSGIVEATENISYQGRDDLKRVVRNFAGMLAQNLGVDGKLRPKKDLEGTWEPFSSADAVSRFSKGEGGVGTWSYKVTDGEDYAGVGVDLTEQEMKDRKLLVICRSKMGYPVYVRFYSFVPGFSTDDDETLVPVESEVNLGNIAIEIEAAYQKMTVPEWWREEKKAPTVKFNPDDIRYFELEATEDAARGMIRDKVQIIRLAVQ